jgi:group I intron endonuclease
VVHYGCSLDLYRKPTMTQVIYKIVNLVNDKFYVGSTINKKVRFRQHRKLLRGNKHHCKHLQAAWNKYGEDKFDFRVVEEVPDRLSLQQVEDIYLMQHVGKPYCYNSGYSAEAPWRNAPAHVTPNFGKAMAQKQKDKISQTLKEFYAEDYFNHPRVGKQHSAEAKAKISAKKLANPCAPWQGKERSDDTKSKISRAQKGVPKAPGRKVSEEGRAKIRANIEAGRSHRHWVGRTHTEESKAKISKAVFVMPDGLMFPSLTAVLEKYQLKMPTLQRALKSGKPISKGRLQGYSFIYGGIKPQFTLTDKLLAFPPNKVA